MANVAYNSDPTGKEQTNSPADEGQWEEEPKSSLNKTIGRVMHLASDGLYRIKNRHKAE